MRFEQLRKKTTFKKEVKIYYWHIYGIIRLSSGSRQMDPKIIEIEEQKTFSYEQTCFDKFLLRWLPQTGSFCMKVVIIIFRFIATSPAQRNG